MKLRRFYIRQLAFNLIISTVIGNFLTPERAKADDFCESPVTSLCNSPEVNDYERVKARFEKLKREIHSSPGIRNFLEEVLGPPEDGKDPKHRNCQKILHLIDKIPDETKKNELDEKFTECQILTDSVFDRLLFPQETKTQIEDLFHRAKNRVIDKINKIMTSGGSSPEKNEKLLAMLDNVAEVHVDFGNNNPRWNVYTYESKPIIEIEGFALLAEIDPSYLLGGIYHEFGHRINPANFLPYSHDRENIPFYDSLSCLKDIGFARSADLSCYQDYLSICKQEKRCEKLEDFINSYQNFPMISYHPHYNLFGFLPLEYCQNDQIAEAFPDLVMVEMLAEEMMGFSVTENRLKLKKYVSFLCSDYKSGEQSEKTFNAFSAIDLRKILGIYPNTELRLNFILNNPGIRRAIGCEPPKTGKKFFCSLEDEN